MRSNLDIDGVWKRIITLDTIRITGKSELMIGRPHRVLELRGPNSGDDRTKPRQQYVLFLSQVFSRCLPPEKVGDVWPGEETAPTFTHCVDPRVDPGDYVLRLLSQVNAAVSLQ
jgi:hypothetical protein